MNIIDVLLTQPLMHTVGWTLIHFLWQGTLLALLLKRSAPQTKYLLAVAVAVGRVFLITALDDGLAARSSVKISGQRRSQLVAEHDQPACQAT